MVLADWDHRLFLFVFGGASHALRIAMVAFSALGSGWSLFAFAPLFAHPKWRRCAAWLVAALVVTAIAVFVVKHAVMRGRPLTVFPALRGHMLEWPTDYSFPSGHAAGTSCFAWFITLASRAAPELRWPRIAAAIAMGFAVCVAVSRVVLGCHFPFDVMGGAILGGLIGAAAGARFARGKALNGSPA